ncbi:30S ribosomal protein S20 [Candidatus Uhrbacteria bacterium]|nr:30S ribosomal protein S20 [Candidatus Uhrbacteria bacterium]
MPNKASAAKEMRKAKKRALLNARTLTHVKALYRKTLDLMKEGKSDEAKQAARSFQQAIDKAAKLNQTTSNKANRKKSALMKAIAQKR